MLRLISCCIDAFSVTIVLLPIMCVLRRTVFKASTLKRTLLILAFAAYLSAVFSAVGIPSANSLIFEPRFNLIPVVDIASAPLSYIRNTVLNIVLFVPLGFMLPLLWAEFQNLKRTALVGFGVSCAIEFLQIFTHRLTDIDDLIANTLGAAIGYALFFAFCGKRRSETPAGGYEPAIIFAAVFLIMFVAAPIISNALWNYILSTPLWEKIR